MPVATPTTSKNVQAEKYKNKHLVAGRAVALRAKHAAALRAAVEEKER